MGDVGDAPQGGTFTQEYAGTLGPSMRAVVPVRDTTGKVVALVSVGITIERIDRGLRGDVLLIGVAALAVLGVGLTGTWLVARRLRRATHGMGEQEITRMYEYYSAVLHAVREGLLLIDDRGRVQLVNDEARRLLGLPEDVLGRPVADLGLPPGLVTAALGRTSEADDIYVAGEHVLVVSSAPASWQGREVGAVVSLRDHTELRSVTGELDVVRGLTESLRSQNHEAANRLHTVVSLIEMGRPDEAVAFATEELQVAQHLTDRMVAQVGDPVVAALLLGKSAEAAERGIELTVSGDLPDLAETVPSRDLVTVLGNLVDNALDAVTAQPDRRVTVHLEGDAGSVRVVVGDSGPGLPPDQAPTCWSAGGPPRPPRTTSAAAGSVSPWSARSRAGTVARSPSGSPSRAVRSSRSRCARPGSPPDGSRRERAGARRGGRGARGRGARGVHGSDRGVRGGGDRALRGGGRPVPVPGPPRRPRPPRHAPAGRPRSRPAPAAARSRTPVRRHRGDLCARRRRGAARRGPGVVLYLLKPFTFATFRAKLEQYASYRARLAAAPDEVVQDEVDQLFGSLRPASGSAPPKGMSPETLRDVTAALRDAAAPMSATEVAEAVGASRVTARRYLEHLAETGQAERRPRYGGSGRPEMEYAWR